MFKKTFFTIAFIALTLFVTGCGKTTTQPAVENNTPAMENNAEQTAKSESKTFDESMKKGLNEYNSFLTTLKNSFKTKNEYPNVFDGSKFNKFTYPVCNYMYFNPKDIILEIELNDKVKAYFCSNKELENCNPEVKKDGVTYSTYKDWVIATKK